MQRFEDGAFVREFEAPTDVDAIGWTPDKRAITYLPIVDCRKSLLYVAETMGAKFCKAKSALHSDSAEYSRFAQEER